MIGTLGNGRPPCEVAEYAVIGKAGARSGYRSDEGEIAKKLHCHCSGSRCHGFREDCDDILRAGGHTQQVGRLLCGVDDTDVAPPTVNGVDHALIAGWFLNEKMYTRVEAMELDNEMCRLNRRGSDPHDPQLTAEHADDGFRSCSAIAHFRKHPTRRPEKRLACWSQLHDTRGTVEEPQTEFTLEPCDGMGECRLAHMQGGRGIGEGPVIGNSHY